ncbi:hypothetical protein F5144DRAFT_479180, partial [Chaetomium tenue]
TGTKGSSTTTMDVNQYACNPHGGAPSGPGTTHTPSCDCCLAYQALKTKEKVRAILVTIQNHIATLEPSPAKSKCKGIAMRLADLCIQYEEVEAVLIRAAKTRASGERQQAAVKLASIMMANAGKKLNFLIVDVTEILEEQSGRDA